MQRVAGYRIAPRTKLRGEPQLPRIRVDGGLRTSNRHPHPECSCNGHEVDNAPSPLPKVCMSETGQQPSQEPRDRHSYKRPVYRIRQLVTPLGQAMGHGPPGFAHWLHGPPGGRWLGPGVPCRELNTLSFRTTFPLVHVGQRTVSSSDKARSNSSNWWLQAGQVYS